jgi:hypothetical protein
MRTIYKYPIFQAGTGTETLQLPSGAQILSVQLQQGAAQLWAVVDPAAPIEPREIYVAGTGHPLPEGAERWRFVDTLQAGGGSFVFHVFEVRP